MNTHEDELPTTTLEERKRLGAHPHRGLAQPNVPQPPGFNKTNKPTDRTNRQQLDDKEMMGVFDSGRGEHKERCNHGPRSERRMTSEAAHK